MPFSQHKSNSIEETYPENYTKCSCKGIAYRVNNYLGHVAIVLIKKGYNVINTMESGEDRCDGSMEIYFGKDYAFPFLPENGKYDNGKFSAHTGVEIQSNRFFISLMAYTDDSLSENEKSELRKKVASELLDWANKIPSINK